MSRHTEPAPTRRSTPLGSPLPLTKMLVSTLMRWRRAPACACPAAR